MCVWPLLCFSSLVCCSCLIFCPLPQEKNVSQEPDAVLKAKQERRKRALAYDEAVRARAAAEHGRQK